MMYKRAFTLIELLVVIAVIATLLAVIVPALRRARLQAMIMGVNSDLRQIGIALQCYQMEHRKFPPTRMDCNDGTLAAHLYQLPNELARGGYLPGTGRLEAKSSAIEDRFNPGSTYKYRSVGECVVERNLIDRHIQAQLWVPNGFPGQSRLDTDQGQWFRDPERTPVQWTVFSLGPQFEETWLKSVDTRYPIPHQLWYSPKNQKGFLVRLRLKNGIEIGSFEGHP